MRRGWVKPMLNLNINSLRDTEAWNAAEIKLPGRYPVSNGPVWVHIGAGNIFRGFIAGLQQRLLNEGLTDKGIIAVETYDFDIIDKIYKPYDNLVVNVTLNANAKVDYEITASISEAIKADGAGMARLSGIFAQPGLQLVSLTITEKGYRPDEADIRYGPDMAGHVMGILTALLYKRYIAGNLPLAVVSLDNCPRNGEVLRACVLKTAEGWIDNGFIDKGFMGYLDGVSFPWSMIDKITPRPDGSIADLLKDKGVAGMAPVITGKNTYIAPFVNAERPQYLVIEDSFPNGRPPLERAGVYMTDRATVNKTERMKVTTCLNPLHTAMSVFGCLLGYERISEEMKDPEITALIKRLGYIEGLPVVANPGIISPKAFLDEVITERLPNPFLPDNPLRIATDTSQKVGIRFGETIKSYINEGFDLSALIAVPLAIAGWFRYLLGMNDCGEYMEISPDPMKDDLALKLDGIVWNDPSSYCGQVMKILSNMNIFGLDLTKTILASRIEEYFMMMLAGPGAVRKTLEKQLQDTSYKKQEE